MLKIILNTMLEAAPYIVLGLLITGFVRVWVPHLTLKRHLAGQGFSPLFKSIGVGCILPTCSCGSMPLGMGLYRCGVKVGNVLAFMTSAPVLSPVLVLLSLHLLGGELTLVMLGSALLGSLMIGLLGNCIFRSETKILEDVDLSCSDCICMDEGALIKRLREGLRWAFFDLGSEVSIDVVIGLSIASLIITVLPLEWIATLLGEQNLSTLLYVILLGIPVYACSIPSIPIVQGLLFVGTTPGAGVAYLLAAPAINLGELNAIRRSMGWKKVVFYVLMLLTIAMIGGVVTDQLIFPDYQYLAFRHQGDLVVRECCAPLTFSETTNSQIIGSVVAPLWHWPFGAVLAIIIGHGICKKLKYFFINPCLGCTRVEYLDGHCGGKCHVRRKYDLLSWIWRRKGEAEDSTRVR